MFISASEEFIEVLASVAWQLAHKRAVIVVLDLVNERRVRLSDQVGYHHHLLLFSLGGKKRFTPDQLCQDAANTPNINGSSVLAPRQNDLGSTIPASSDVVS